MTPSPPHGAAAQLRADFNGAFARPAAPSAQAGTALLALRLDGRPYALRLDEIASLAPGRSLLPVPQAAPAFVGLAGQRGGLWPVWDLGALLGHAGLRGTPRWLALAAGAPVWAAAFEHFEGYLMAAPADLHPLQGGQASPWAQQACAAGGVVRPVLQLERLRSELRSRSNPSPNLGEPRA